MNKKKACATLLTLLIAFPAVAEKPRVAIIIDDLGYQLEAGRRAIALPGPLAFAVLPNTPRGSALAEMANENGKEVLLHLPLQSLSHRGPAEPGGIMLDMSQQRVERTFRQAIESVPYVIGVNSHRGSLLTRHPGHMRWLMDEIRDRERLFFIDSFTTHESVAMQIAGEAGVDAVKRDVFLDPDRDPETVAREFERMKRLARKRGTIVAIGHPYPATLELLERELPKLEREGIELVTISTLFREPPAVNTTINAQVPATR
jgi:polysaccharide deacetylase 2 family uncharacterized protein YibQ